MAISVLYRDSIESAVKKAIVISPAGALLPALDVAGVTGIWVWMIRDIAASSGRDLDIEVATKLVGSILAGAGAYWTGSRLFTWALNAIPFAGTLTSIGLNAFLNGYYTYKLGCGVARRFEQYDFAGDVTSLASDMIRLLRVFPSVDELRDLYDIIFG